MEADDRLLPPAAGAARRRCGGCSPAWIELPAQGALGLLVLALGVGQAFPFFFAMSEGAAPIWDTLFDYLDGDSVQLPAVLATITALAAVAGAKAHGKKRALCSFRVIYWMIHAVNALPLLYAVPWWWKGSLSESPWGDLMEAIAYVSGVLCQFDMGLCLLPLARESAWLNTACVAYPEGIPFHRITGWWCVIQTLVHSIAEVLAVMTEAAEEYAQKKYATTAGEFSGTSWHASWSAMLVFLFPWVQRLNDETAEPELNSEGLLNFLGLIGTLCSTVLAIYSLPAVRRRLYHWFYFVHVPMAAGFIVMGMLHSVPMTYFVLPGLTALFIDRSDYLGRTAVSRAHRAVATATIMTEDWLRLDIAMGAAKLSTEGALGTQWVYLRVPAVSGEWHPFSLAAREPSIIIKGVGDWSTALHKLAVKTALTARKEGEGERGETKLVCQLPVDVDGVYGSQTPPWGSYSHLLMIGGGVGVTPWLPLMEHGLDSSQRCSLVFVVRDEQEYHAMRPWLPAGDRTRAFVTRPKRSETEMRDLPDEPAAGGSCQTDPSSVPTIVAGSSLLFAVVALGALAVTYLLYYALVLRPEDEEDGGMGMGGMGGGGAEDDGSGSDDSRRPPPPPPHWWKPTTLWRYFWIKLCAPVFGGLLSVVVLTVVARWIRNGLGKLQCPFGKGASGLPAPARAPSSAAAATASASSAFLAIPSVGHGVTPGRERCALLSFCGASSDILRVHRPRSARSGGGRRQRRGDARAHTRRRRRARSARALCLRVRADWHGGGGEGGRGGGAAGGWREAARRLPRGGAGMVKPGLGVRCTWGPAAVRVLCCVPVDLSLG